MIAVYGGKQIKHPSLINVLFFNLTQTLQLSLQTLSDLCEQF